jgi:multiple sugar transport system permease protein
MTRAATTRPATSAGLVGRRRRYNMRRRRTATALAFLSPALLIIAVWVVWPMIQALRTSFTDSSLFGASHWVGLQNYRRLWSDSRFTNDLKNTAIYALFTTVISVAVALLLALALDQRLRGRGLFRAVIFFPFITSLAISSIAWAFMLDPQLGIISAWISKLGLSIGDGVRDPNWALPVVTLVGIWRNVGFFMVMYLAGLQSIPKELKEAATVDGAGPLQRFRYVTWPLLSNTTMFVVMISAIFSFQAFDQMYVMTSGGPFFRSETLVMLIYSTGFVDYRLGYASAISWMLVAIVLTLSLVQMRFFSRRTVTY